MNRILLQVAAIAVASPAYAAGGENVVTGMLWQAFNLLLLIGVIFYFGRTPIRNYVSARRREIESNIENSASVLSQSENQLAEWNARAARLDGELNEIREGARQRAASEREAILADAVASAERIRSDARASVAQELERARETLRNEAAELATDLAAELLSRNATDEDRESLIYEFVSRVESESPHGRSS